MNDAVGSPLPVTLEVDHLQVCVRAITPDDRERILEGLRSMSVETTYRRFFTPKFYPNERELRYLTEVDGEDHVAIGAVDCTREGFPGIGAARCIRLPEEPTVAEAAIVVIDAYQRRGIGSLLLAALSRSAARRGIEQFRGYVLANNTDVLSFLRALGAEIERTHDGVMQIGLPVYAHANELPPDPQLDRARRAWTTLAEAPRGEC